MFKAFRADVNVRPLTPSAIIAAVALASLPSSCSAEEDGDSSVSGSEGDGDPPASDSGDAEDQDQSTGGATMTMMDAEPANNGDGAPADPEGAGGMAPGDVAMGGSAGAPPAVDEALEVVSVSPTARSLSAGVSEPLVIEFNRAVDPATVSGTSLWAFGRWSGPVRDGTYTYSEDKKTVTLASPRAWSAGDRVTVVLSHDLASADGQRLRSAGYSFQYWTASKPAPGAFELVQTLSTGERTLAYGGSAADLNGDSFLDLMVINEQTADLRVFMNTADGSGEFERLEGPFLLDDKASPSEPTDFNADGKVDIVVANLDGDNLSILFGDGDGSFTPSQKILVGDQPRGVAVFDFDGDGDIDIANTNASSDNMSVLLNDGTGKFPEEDGEGFYFFDAGDAENPAVQEWSVMSGDMDEDGILDLVIGARGRVEGDKLVNAGVVIWSGTGDGKFSFASMSEPSAKPWQLAVGDLNADGHEDVVSADNSFNSTSQNTVTLLQGDGAFKLELTQTYTDAIQRPTAIDMGDLDGDGDLDLVVSNYAANWEVLQNDGSGQMSLSESLASDDPGGVQGSASCALLMDIDNDGDLDLALIDENEDQVTFMKH